MQKSIRLVDLDDEKPEMRPQPLQVTRTLINEYLESHFSQALPSDILLGSREEKSVAVGFSRLKTRVFNIWRAVFELKKAAAVE